MGYILMVILWVLICLVSAAIITTAVGVAIICWTRGHSLFKKRK